MLLNNNLPVNDNTSREVHYRSGESLSKTDVRIGVQKTRRKQRRTKTRLGSVALSEFESGSSVTVWVNAGENTRQE